MHPSRLFFPLLALLLASLGCSTSPPTGPTGRHDLALERSGLDRADARSGPGPVTPAGGGTSASGEIGPGSSYFLHVPEGWNGDLVLYVHGYTAPFYPLGPPPTEPVESLRDEVLALGLAFGYSTFSENGYALRDAVQRTQQLEGLFSARFGPPRRVYLVGYSLGGLAVLSLVERHPESYAGAVTVSGIVGGTKRELDYLGNVWVLFDLLYPGVLPWGLYDAPASFDPNQIIGPVVAAIQANPQPALILTQIDQTPIPFSNGEELVQSIVQALVLEGIALPDLLERTHGHPFFDNAKTTYTGNLPPEVLADINARVARYEARPDAEAWLRQQYEPSGKRAVPLISLHMLLDPVVPIFHEEVYHDLVKEAGADRFHLRRDVPGYGHPVTPVELVVQAIDDVERWVETGVRPAK